MKNTINLSFLHKASQLRTSNPLVNAILLLVVLVTLPLLLILGIIIVLTIAVIARIRMISNLFRPVIIAKPRNTVHFEQHNTAEDHEGFAEYEIVDEKIGQ